jgi:hypothetical protein
MSNAEGMKLLAEFVKLYRVDLLEFAVTNLQDAAKARKAVKDIEANLEILSEGGQLSGGV